MSDASNISTNAVPSIKPGEDISISDAEIEDKYESGTNKLLQQHERIKLPRLASDIRFNPNYIIIDTAQSSSWDVIKQSRLIESLIINIPVPPIILYEESYRKYKIIDGRERLKAIADFYNNRLALTGLEVYLELEGRTCATLPVRIKSKLNLRSLDLTTIIPKSDLSPEKVARLIEIVAARLAKS